MNRFVTSAITTLLLAGVSLHAAQAAVEFQLDESYVETADISGSFQLASGEVDHNLDSMPAAAMEDSTPPSYQEPAVTEPEAKPEKVVAMPAATKEKPVKAKEIPLIETQNDNSNAADVTYVTGGIGDDEKQAIEASKGDYNVYIMSASVSGAFVGDAHVTITRKNGAETESMLSVVAGPLLYVKLPAGTYQLEAKLGEQVKKQTFTLGKKASTQNIHLGWKVAATLSQ